MATVGVGMDQAAAEPTAWSSHPLPMIASTAMVTAGAGMDLPAAEPARRQTTQQRARRTITSPPSPRQHNNERGELLPVRPTQDNSTKTYE